MADAKQYCPTCGAEVSPRATVCLKCEQPLAVTTAAPPTTSGPRPSAGPVYVAPKTGNFWSRRSTLGKVGLVALGVFVLIVAASAASGGTTTTTTTTPTVAQTPAAVVAGRRHDADRTRDNCCTCHHRSPDHDGSYNYFQHCSYRHHPGGEAVHNGAAAGHQEGCGLPRLSGFSRSGLIDQLKYEGFSTEDATVAVDSITVDWNEQAARKAASTWSFRVLAQRLD